MDAAPEVRLSRPDEWRQARDLRLEMLADTPIAYLERLEDAAALDEDRWERRHRERFEAPDIMATVVALDPHPATPQGARLQGAWLGQMGLVINQFEEPKRCWLGAVYLSPALRGSGVAERMLDQAQQWVVEHGLSALFLEVHEDNTRAIRFYERTGFVHTGARRPNPLDPRRDELEMRKDL